jgi:hypothetical protein
MSANRRKPESPGARLERRDRSKADIPRDQRSIATLVSRRAYLFLHVGLDNASSLATGLSICQSSTSWLSTSRPADLMADSSSMQSS